MKRIALVTLAVVGVALVTLVALTWGYVRAMDEWAASEHGRYRY